MAPAYRTVVSTEVERLLGPEVVGGWAQAIDTHELPCYICPDLIDPSAGESVTLSVAVMPPDPGENRPTLEVLVAHERCGRSRILVPGDDVPQDLPPGPPAVAMVKPGGTRAVLLLGFYAPKLGMPVGARGSVDSYLRPLMELGLELVLVPYDQFETRIESWSLTVTTEANLVLQGPMPLAFTIPCPDLSPPWTQALAEQGRCLVLVMTSMDGEGFVTGRGDPAAEVLAAIDQARMAGRLLGGVVAASIHADAGPPAGPEEPLSPPPSRRAGPVRGWLRRSRPQPPA